MNRNKKISVLLCINFCLLMIGYNRVSQSLQVKKEEIEFSERNRKLSEPGKKYGYAEVLESVRHYDLMKIKKIELVSDSKSIVTTEVEYEGAMNVLVLYLLEISQQENFLKINELQIENSGKSTIKCLAKIDFVKNK